MSIPLQLVTGFLGSGKTTFLKQFLKALGNSAGKIAIIQNEFSPVNMDGQELKAEYNTELLEVNNGSVFCVCLLGSFIDSLQAFVNEVKPDILLMETSGLSDTLGVGQIFQSEKLRGKVYLDKVWCMVDALHFKRAGALRLRLEHQVRTADVVAVTKLDIADLAFSEIQTEIQKINPFAQVVKTQFGYIPDYDLPAKMKFFPPEDPVGGRPVVESVVVRTANGINRKDLLEFLRQQNKHCIRAKGFVRLKDGSTVFVHLVFDQIELSDLANRNFSTELVMLGNFSKNGNLQVQYDEFCRR